MIRLMIAWKSDAFKDTHFSFLIRGGDSLIPRVRNSIVAEFLSKDQYTHLLWIDADIGFTPEDVLRLLDSGHDVACGIYPLKKINFPDHIPGPMTQEEFKVLYTSYPFNPIARTFNIPPNGFVEVLDAPTGLMLVKRECLLKMMVQYPELKYKPDTMLGLEGIAEQIDNYYYRFFDVMVDDAGRYLSEDYAYCYTHNAMLPTENGIRSIKWVVDNKYSGKVLSLNIQTGAQEWNNVTHHWSRANGKRGVPESKKTWVKINTDVDNNKKAKLIVTSDHQIAVFRDLMNPIIEYVAAKDATGFYTVREPAQHTNENRIFTKQGMSAAVGTLMGDASILRHKQMSISHCTKQLDYLEYKQSIFGGSIDTREQTGFGVGKIIHRLMVPVNAQTRHLRSITHPKGGHFKDVSGLLPLIDDVALAFWYMDDGSLTTGGSPMLSTYCFTHEEHVLMQNMFADKFGINTTIQNKTVTYKDEKRRYEYLYVTAESRGAFFSLISSHIHPSMDYKLPEEYRSDPKTLIERNDEMNFAASLITSVSVSKTHSRLYDIEVANNHNFFANGALAHNCRRWQAMGGKVYADMHSKLTHQGQYLYEGNVLKTLVARTEMVQKQEAANQEAAAQAAATGTNPV